MAERFKEFKDHPVPIRELEVFLRLDEKRIPNERPYAWYMFVMTADGIGSLAERSYPNRSVGLGGTGLALRHLIGKVPEAEGAKADADMLQFGWAVADAVLGGANLLRAEPTLKMAPWDKRFLDYRARLGKDRLTNIFLTANGFSAEEMKGYPILRSKDLRVIIATSENGHARMMAELKKLDD